MNLRLSTFAVVTAIASTVMPQAAGADAFNGVYVGGSVGLFSGAFIEETNDSGTTYDGEIIQFGIEETFPSKVDLLIGFGRRVDDMYLGIEGSYTVSNEMSTHTRRYSSGMDEYIALDDGAHIGARIGYFLSERTMSYFKLAAAERNIEVYGDAFSEDSDFSGSGYGIGVEHNLGSQFTVRLEATRFDYSNETMNFSGYEFHYDPVETSVDIALLYHF